MKDLIHTLLDKRVSLIENLGTHALKVEKKLSEKRVKDLSEGIVPDFDKDSETEYIKKLTERPEDREERFEDSPPPADDEELPSPEFKDKDEEDKDKDDELEKEYLGKKEETYYYLTKGDSDEEGEGRGQLQVVDQEGKVVYTSEDSEADSSDVFHFLIDAVRDIEPDDVSYDMFVKYVVPKIEELEKEQDEYAKDNEFPDEEPPDEDREEDRFRESKKNENLQEIRVTFDRREFDVKLVDEAGSRTVIEINGKRFDFSPEFSRLFRDESGTITEDKLEELALGALSEMDKADFDDLVTKGPEHRQHKKAPADEACGAKHKKKKYMKEAADVAGGVKDLVKSASDAIKDDNFIEAVELCQRLATIQQALPMGGEEGVGADVGEEAPPVEDEVFDDEPSEDELKAEVEAAAEDDEELDDEELKNKAELEDEEEEENKEGKVPKSDDSESKVIDKLEEKSPPTCPKCDKAHWPFHKCDSVAKKDDSEEEKPAENKGEDKEEDKKKETKEGIVPDTEKDSEEEVIKKLTEMCGICKEDPCSCEEKDDDVEPRKPKKKLEF